MVFVWLKADNISDFLKMDLACHASQSIYQIAFPTNDLDVRR